MGQHTDAVQKQMVSVVLHMDGTPVVHKMESVVQHKVAVGLVANVVRMEDVVRTLPVKNVVDKSAAIRL